MTRVLVSIGYCVGGAKNSRAMLSGSRKARPEVGVDDLPVGDAELLESVRRALDERRHEPIVREP
jgi:hypothetical protein